MLLTTIKLALAKSTRILVYILLGILFNVGSQTDEFFLAYSLATFSATIATSLESYLLEQNKRMIGVITVGLGPIILILALLIYLSSNSLLVFLFLPYIVSSTLASAYTGVVNKKKQYRITILSSTAYILILPLVLVARIIDTAYILELIILLITVPELVRLALLVILKDSELGLIKELKTINKSMFLILSVPVVATITLVTDKIIIANILPAGSVSVWTYSFGLVGIVAGLVNYGRVVHLTNNPETTSVSIASLNKPIKLGIAMIFITMLPILLLSRLSLELEVLGIGLNIQNSLQLILPVLAIAIFMLPLKYPAASLVVRLIHKQKYNRLLIALLVSFITRTVLVLVLSRVNLVAVAVGVICSELVYLIIIYYYAKDSLKSPSYSSSY